MSKSKLSKKECAALYYKVESEGFGYYLFDYGPDIEVISKLGFDKEKVIEAIKLLRQVQEKIYEAEEYAEDFYK